MKKNFTTFVLCWYRFSERLWSLPHWRYWRTSWTQSYALRSGSNNKFSSLLLNRVPFCYFEDCECIGLNISWIACEKLSHRWKMEKLGILPYCLPNTSMCWQTWSVLSRTPSPIGSCKVLEATFCHWHFSRSSFMTLCILWNQDTMKSKWTASQTLHNSNVDMAALSSLLMTFFKINWIQYCSYD